MLKDKDSNTFELHGYTIAKEFKRVPFTSSIFQGEFHAVTWLI